MNSSRVLTETLMMTTMTIFDLPVDLLSEIVCRVPRKDMRAVRLTCKRWDNLWRSDMFRKMHIARESGESRIVAIMDSSLHLISVDVDHPSTECKGKLNSDQEIIKVFHCEGLLLCVLRDTFRLLVWNPYLGQTRWIEPPSSSYRESDGIDRYTYAFGWDNEISSSHKILRFMDDYSHQPRRRPIPHLDCYEIYDFDCNLWRTLDVGAPHWYIFYNNIGVPLNGNTYWLARQRNSDYGGSDRLISFDFTSERFGPILPLPFPSEEHPDVLGILSSIKGDKLSLLLQHGRPSEIEIWVTDPNNVLWSNLFKVVMPLEIYFSSSGFFIDEEKKVAMVFDKYTDTHHTLNIIGEAGFLRQVDVDPLTKRALYGHAHVCSYVPSLVQVQIKKPVFKRILKRKQPSKFEEEEKEKEEEAKRRRQTLEKLRQLTSVKKIHNVGKFEIRPCQQSHEEEEAKRTRRT